jgi:hypothetical protein
MVLPALRRTGPEPRRVGRGHLDEVANPGASLVSRLSWHSTQAHRPVSLATQLMTPRPPRLTAPRSCQLPYLPIP